MIRRGLFSANLLTRRRRLLDEGMAGLDDGVSDPPLPVLPLVEKAPPWRAPWNALPGVLKSTLNFFRAPPADGRVSYAGDAKAAGRDLPRGAPPAPVQVWPAWESRLVNMRDFLAVNEVQPEGPTATPVVITLPVYTIPQGQTAFWKEFRFFMDPVPVGYTAINVRVTLLIDETPVPDYTNLPVGPFMDDFLKTFVIAGSGRRITLQIAFTSIGSIPDDTSFVGLLYGNSRFRTGQSEAQEVGVKHEAPPPPPSKAPGPAAAPAPAAARPAKGFVLHGGRAGTPSGKAGHVKTGRLGA